MDHLGDPHLKRIKSLPGFWATPIRAELPRNPMAAIDLPPGEQKGSQRRGFI